jgi:hypothetical protein
LVGVAIVLARPSKTWTGLNLNSIDVLDTVFPSLIVNATFLPGEISVVCPVSCHGSSNFIVLLC